MQVNRCLGFLDRSSIDPCSDEILMNTVLETYIRHKEYRWKIYIFARFLCLFDCKKSHKAGSESESCLSKLFVRRLEGLLAKFAACTELS